MTRKPIIIRFQCLADDLVSSMVVGGEFDKYIKPGCRHFLALLNSPGVGKLKTFRATVQRGEKKKAFRVVENPIGGKRKKVP